MRLIDADALLSDIERTIVESGCVNHEGEIMDCVRYASEVDAVPVVRGEWIYSRTQSEFSVSKCSACGKEQFSISHVVKDGKYCPNCGAKMEDKP